MTAQWFFENTSPYIAEMFMDLFMEGVFNFSCTSFVTNVALQTINEIAALAPYLLIGS